MNEKFFHQDNESTVPAALLNRLLLTSTFPASDSGNDFVELIQLATLLLFDVFVRSEICFCRCRILVSVSESMFIVEALRREKVDRTLKRSNRSGRIWWMDEYFSWSNEAYESFLFTLIVILDSRLQIATSDSRTIVCTWKFKIKYLEGKPVESAIRRCRRYSLNWFVEADEPCTCLECCNSMDSARENKNS